jgi:hypothetical protein
MSFRKPLPAYPRNHTEHSFFTLIQDAGGTPVNRGWPDCAVFGKDHHLKAFVEVKPIKGRRRLQAEQHFMLSRLASFGVPCFTWSPSGLAKILADGSTEFVDIEVLNSLL